MVEKWYCATFLVQTLQYLQNKNVFFAIENIKKAPSKVSYFTAPIFFSITNRSKFHILFHKNGSLRDFYIMTLFANCKVIMRTTIARILCTVNSLPMIISEGFSGRKKIPAKSIFHWWSLQPLNMQNVSSILFFAL